MDALRVMQVPLQRDGAEIRVVLETIEGLANGACARGLVPYGDRDDLVQEALLTVMTTSAVFRGHTDFEARAYLRCTVNARAVDLCRKRKRAARTGDAFARECSASACASGEGAVVVVLELRRAMDRLARASGERDLLSELDAYGMLPWTERARWADVALAERLAIRLNTLHARRSRLRRSVASVTGSMVRAGELAESERETLLALVSPDR
ncbi:MAG: sigma-70 family RNA polymerase sigma factor [Myxococcales bacterium]|nr:sigma-70 family RNA polymerase sigma factor [Myxococcales bacterium]